MRYIELSGQRWPNASGHRYTRKNDCLGLLIKHCLLHGREEVLIADDVDYYKKCNQFIKPADMPLKFNTPIKYGCPYDCGVCPDPEQHSCLTLIEVTDQCNLSCPICYADSTWEQSMSMTY